MPSQEELFAAVDELLTQPRPVLPLPEERQRLRKAAGLTQDDVARALQSRRETVNGWESGRTDPRPPRLEAYLRLLEGWAAKYPAHPAPDTEVFTGPAATPDAPTAPTGPANAPATAPAPEDPPPPQRPASAASRPAVTTGPAPTSRRPARPKTVAPVADPRFPHGPLAVLDGEGTAFCLGGVLLECAATTIPQLVDWTLKESGIGAPRLNKNGKDSDPLIVLTAAAAVRFGLPERLEGHEARRNLRLPEDHPVVKQITKAKWKLTQRGFGPWARIYRPAKGSQRQCVQLTILPWDALDTRAWGDAATLHPADLARVLGVYASRVITPRGSTAVSGLELMTAMRPPTRPVKDDTTGEWVSGPNPGALTRPIDPAPPEAPLEHPAAQGWTGGFLDEEAYQWVRDPKLLSDEECLLPWAVGIDINTAFLAAAARLTVGLSQPAHVMTPGFDKKIPGSWLVDFSHIELDPRLPNPFTPTGQRPEGPGWYATPTVAYAVELGYGVTPAEAYLRHETGAYLDPWHDRLKDAFVTTTADMGVPTDKDTDESTFLTAMALHKTYAAAHQDGLEALRTALRELAAGRADLAHLTDRSDEDLQAAIHRHRQGAMVLSAIKSTVKGGIGKLRERPQGRHYTEGERWPALERATWSPHIRAMLIAKARVNMHRKLAKLAALTGLYPLAVLSDCAVYASPGSSPLDFLPHNGDGTPVYGTFRIGANPGFCKVEGVQEMAWAVDLMEQGYNPARHIKGGDAVMDEGE
ncbi:helix-turn-helix transcriptional regulator [Streptomyces sp. ADMS]|uniref:telomere-associated protein Tap n=1 Tax=Streptomyces sp. ADMS TaxID=3071415 RepID=UPI00296EE4B9|nr:helix-turn-helix transcriptional regulator [Streptomyces sp. ADMS]MDW4911308.1 helix-turn-helix transcriptional regulator [Streptomyces sp. ADMS]